MKKVLNLLNGNIKNLNIEEFKKRFRNVTELYFNMYDPHNELEEALDIVEQYINNSNL